MIFGVPFQERIIPTHMILTEEIIDNLQLAGSNIAKMLAYDPSAPMLFSSGLFWLLFILILPE